MKKLKKLFFAYLIIAVNQEKPPPVIPFIEGVIAPFLREDRGNYVDVANNGVHGSLASQAPWNLSIA
ncbi:MAG: hypothetical protein PHW60_14410 [Kiritimatiellae bacterium]|nr:hypothetical protein [Kiritimatiellia bacterium]